MQARHLDGIVQIRIEGDGKTLKDEGEGRSWRDRVNEMRLSAADNYIATLGGELRKSETGFRIELPGVRD